jgi:hypothetical protein
METELIGVSQNIKHVRELIDQVADSCLNTLVPDCSDGCCIYCYGDISISGKESKMIVRYQ